MTTELIILSVWTLQSPNCTLLCDFQQDIISAFMPSPIL